MKDYRYIEGVSTLRVDHERCIGCGNCVLVCPHRILSLATGGLEVSDCDLCMECGACARNCPVEAIAVTPGVGCATAILAVWINRILGRQTLAGCC